MSSPFTPAQRKRLLELAKKKTKIVSDDDLLYGNIVPSYSAERRYTNMMKKRGGSKRKRSKKKRSKKLKKTSRKKSKH